jgi:hypothetical protein
VRDDRARAPSLSLCADAVGRVTSDVLGSLLGMGARFIGGDREQVFLMPPSVRDWVPEGHLVWTVLDAVAELDLSAIYAGLSRRRARPSGL